jgi:hypothetical protein
MRRLVLSVVFLAACDGSGGNARFDAGPPPPPPPRTCEVPAELEDVSEPDRIVGTGAPESCTAEALAGAIALGGTITFDCGGEATIELAQTIRVERDVLIDGGGLVAISGRGAVRIFDMNTGDFTASTPHLRLQRITLRDGRANGAELEGGGGAIFYRGGSVTAIDVRFIDNTGVESGPDIAGGAIFGTGVGVTTVVGCTFMGNRAPSGGAIGALGTAVTVVNSTFAGNVATGSGGNPGDGGNGGAISIDGQGREIYVCGSTFRGNRAGALGGAMFRTGYETEPNEIHLSTFDQNESVDQQGSGAGALYFQGVHVTLTRSTISNNRARSSAGLWVLNHGAAQGVLDMTNVTIADNATYERDDFTMRGLSAGLTMEAGTRGSVLNCTIANNAAQFASGIANVSSLSVRNTIIANHADNEWTPLNCTGAEFSSPPGSGENNVQWPIGMSADSDMDCTPAIARMDPRVGPLGENGGPTPTALPMNTELPRGSDCPELDQRGMPRAEACTIGAVELP